MSETVESYAERGLKLWQVLGNGHRSLCPCLTCADTRKYLGREALVPQIAPTPARRQERAS